MRAHCPACNFVVSVALLCTLFILGCGGSGSSSSKASSSTTPPAPTFTLSAGTPKVSVSAGGSPVTVSLAITGSAGFASTVQVVATGVPAGVTVSPVSISGLLTGLHLSQSPRLPLSRRNLYPDFHRNRFYAADAKRGGVIDHRGRCRTTAAAAVTQLLSEHYRAVSISAGRHGHCYLDGHLCWRI